MTVSPTAVWTETQSQPRGSVQGWQPVVRRMVRVVREARAAGTRHGGERMRQHHAGGGEWARVGRGWENVHEGHGFGVRVWSHLAGGQAPRG